MVEHSTADREVPGSNPGVPFYFLHMQLIILLQIVKGYISASMMQHNNWGYSSVVEHSTADREVPGSNPGVPFYFLYMQAIIITTGCEGLHIRFDDIKEQMWIWLSGRAFDCRSRGPWFKSGCPVLFILTCK